MNGSSLGQIPIVDISPEPGRGKWVKKLEAFVSRHRQQLAWVHAIMFFGFMALMIVPLWLPLPDDHARLYNNFNRFANFVIWGLWFPLVFVSVIFTGRSWCGILCPLGAASEWANRVGLKRPIPLWVRWEGTPIISFAVITIMAQTLDARGFATGLAIVFGSAFVCAIALGFMYGRGGAKRAWCRHMCPIGLMLGVFSRIGAIQFTPKLPKAGGDNYTEKTVCPTLIDIPRKQESRHCIECFRCVHPEAKGGLKVKLRLPGHEVANIRHHNPNSAEIWFLFLATGLSLGGFMWLVLPQYDWMRQLVGSWVINQGWYWIGSPGPFWLMSVHPAGREVYTWLDFGMITSFMLAYALVAACVLGGLTALSSWMAGRLGADSTQGGRFIEQAYAYMPVAMVSLVIGLGSELFVALTLTGLSATAIIITKSVLFLGGTAWSVGLGWRLLSVEGLGNWRRLLTLTPLLTGIALIGLAWWPAIFG